MLQNIFDEENSIYGVFSLLKILKLLNYEVSNNLIKQFLRTMESVLPVLLSIYLSCYALFLRLTKIWNPSLGNGIQSP